MSPVMQAESTDKRSFSEKFTHLHLHTTYSLLDGAIRIPELMQHCKENGMDSVAITDHGNMFGVIEFYTEAVKAGIKPIIGNEFYVSPGKMSETKVMENLADGNNYHLILLAQNETGYRNLIKLTSKSYTDGFYRKPRIDYEFLSHHAEGLICLTACLGGEVQRKILTGQESAAEQLAGKLKEIFGPERFYLEIQNHGLEDERIAAKGNVELSRRLGIPLVLTNDSHFLTRKHHEVQDILLRINQKKSIDEDLAFAFNPEFYVKSPEEMSRLFPELPDAFHNTRKIAEMISMEFQSGNPLLPNFDVPEGHSLNSYMRELCLQGLARRYGTPLHKDVMDRFEFEMQVIEGMDFPGYFLIVQDFINWAKARGIPVGPGRGSAAGSIVAYGLGITDIDPLRYGLLFERFLNPARKEMPDIDVDFCVDRREEVINYVRHKYGEDHVAQIVTYGTMAAKACMKDVARVLKMPFAEANNISKMIPSVPGTTLDDAYEKSSEFRNYVDNDELGKKVYSVAKALEGNSRHTGVHAAGVVIGPRPLDEIVPLATVATPGAGDKKTKQRILVTQYDMTTLALPTVGLVKMDFLGLRNLTVIANCVRGIEQRTGKTLDLNEIPLDDSKAYGLLQTGNVKGVFQLETSPGMREFVIRMKPEVFEDLVALIAMYRPGPLQSGMADAYVNRKKGREKVIYPHDDLAEILGETYGVVLYQEQVMQISQKIGGFTPAKSDDLRKAMGKKKKDKMAELKLEFIEGANARGYNDRDKDFAAKLYDQLAEFAGYGFNKSHSAAYAMVVYRTAYLKANYPTDYMAAVLDSEIDKTDRLVPYILECKEMGLEILGPDINHSYLRFHVEKEGVIRFGLNAIKNVGAQAVQSIVETRDQEGGFKSFFHFMENTDLKLCNRRTLESMVLAGCFETMGYTRKALMESLDLAVQHGQNHQKDRVSGQSSLFDAMGPQMSEEEPIPRGSDVAEYDETTLLNQEKQVLGIYFSGHPLSKYERFLKSARVIPIEKLGQFDSGKIVEIAAVISEATVAVNKKNNEYGRLQIEDLTGRVACIVFPKTFAEIRSKIEVDQAFWVKAKIDKNDETGTVQLLVDGLAPLNRESLEEKLERSLHLQISREDLNQNVIQNLVTLFRCHQGPLAVYFHLSSANGEGAPVDSTVIRAHETFGVSWNQELQEKLSNIPQVRGAFLTVGEQSRTLLRKAEAV
mgnify:FL=1